jgi:hypothetical protein
VSAGVGVGVAAEVWLEEDLRPVRESQIDMADVMERSAGGWLLRIGTFGIR